MFSKACQYAIRALVLITMESRNGRRMSLVEIADRTGSPQAFTAKVLQQLAREGLITSTKGPNGGFDLPPAKAKKVKLSMVVKAIDGDQVYRGCGMGLPDCNAKKPCPLHDHFQQVRDDLRDMLERTDVHMLSLGLEEGRAVLKR
ncbi:MAG: Rrf2 family transcriptional regulator [Flavobacteriales bacterium]|jgi:Rrf2 family protein|nr:Rrf2 family transcriptional regulator [Flavobacteriales bacterium]